MLKRTLGSIHRLPVEIMQEIFRYDQRPMFVGSGWAVPTAIRLRGVCRQWRDIIDGTPEYWSTIVLRDSEELVKWRLSKSAKWPLSVEISIIKMLPAVLQESERWRHMIWHSSPHQHSQSTLSLPSSLPALEDLEIPVSDVRPGGDAYYGPLPHALHQTLCTTSSNLRHLSVCLNHLIQLRPLLSRLHSIKIVDGISIGRPVQAIADSLVLCIALRQIDFSFTSYNVVPEDQDIFEVPEIRLPRLELLKIDILDLQWLCLLGFLRPPSSAKLYLILRLGRNDYSLNERSLEDLRKPDHMLEIHRWMHLQKGPSPCMTFQAFNTGPHLTETVTRGMPYWMIRQNKEAPPKGFQVYRFYSRSTETAHLNLTLRLPQTFGSQVLNFMASILKDLGAPPTSLVTFNSGLGGDYVKTISEVFKSAGTIYSYANECQDVEWLQELKSSERTGANSRDVYFPHATRVFLDLKYNPQRKPASLEAYIHKAIWTRQFRQDPEVTSCSKIAELTIFGGVWTGWHWGTLKQWIPVVKLMAPIVPVRPIPAPAPVDQLSGKLGSLSI